MNRTLPRKTHHQFWMGLAQYYTQRATCARRKCAAVFVQDNRIVSAGYNSAPSGQPHCDEVGCLMVEGHCKRCNHAERAGIDYAANQGIRLDGASVFIAGGTPCSSCAHGLIAVRTQAIYVDSFYPDPTALELLQAAKIPIVGMFTRAVWESLQKLQHPSSVKHLDHWEELVDEITLYPDSQVTSTGVVHLVTPVVLRAGDSITFGLQTRPDFVGIADEFLSENRALLERLGQDDP